MLCSSGRTSNVPHQEGGDSDTESKARWEVGMRIGMRQANGACAVWYRNRPRGGALGAPAGRVVELRQAGGPGFRNGAGFVSPGNSGYWGTNFKQTRHSAHFSEKTILLREFLNPGKCAGFTCSEQPNRRARMSRDMSEAPEVILRYLREVCDELNWVPFV